MTALFPRDFITEMHLGTLGWTDVSTRVHQPSKVTITRGSGSEQALTTPDLSKFAFFDPDDELNPDNPVGPYYEQLGQNIPVRQSVVLVREPFTANATDSWGTAPVVGAASLPWSLVGGAADFDRAGGRGQIRIPTANLAHYAYLPGIVARNARVKLTYIPTLFTPAGGAIDVSILLRGTGTNSYYEMRMNVATSGAVTLSSRVVLGGVETVITSSVVADATHSLAIPIGLSAEVEGWAIRGKAWNGTAEPLGWALSGFDTLERRPDPGWIGVRVGVAAGNTNVPILFEFDNLEISKPRFEGRVHKLAPKSDVTNRVKFVTAEAGGVLRTLSRPEGSAPLLSASRRYAPTVTNLRAFWPLEEGFTDEVRGVGQVGPSGSTMRFEQETGLNPDTGEIRWGGDTTLPSIVGAPQLTNGGRLIAEVPADLIGSGNPMGIAWGMRVSPDAGAQILIDTATPGEGIFMTFFTDGTMTAIRNPGGVTMFANPIVFDAEHEAPWHHYAVEALLLGADTVFTFYVDGVALRGHTLVGDTWSPITRATFVAPNATTTPLAITQVVLTTLLDPIVALPGLHRSMFGWPGEAAGRRMERLCAEEGVPFSYLGGLDDTEAMGPQRPGLPLLAHGRECEAVDMGLLGEPLTEGLTYRTRRHAYNRAPLLTLDYAGHQVAELVRSRDDRFVANDVTAERIGGGTRRRTQTTGPMGTDTIGTIPASPKVNVETDAQLEDQASRRLQLGTDPRLRLTRVVVDMRAEGLTMAQQIAAMDLDPLDRIGLQSLEAVSIYADVEQVVRGYTEVWGTTGEHRIWFNTAPAEPWDVPEADTAEHRVSDSGTTTLDLALASGATSITCTTAQVAGTDELMWTEDPAMLPLLIEIGGEVMEVDDIFGGSPAQTMTVSQRNVNGLPVTGGKTHLAGSVVRLYGRRYAG